MSRDGTVRLGAGAGFAGDRIDPAQILAERGELDYLIFECLGERTVATGQARKLLDP
ncbi:MAG: acyclic terpene utilization AtuA family protein, partial [Rhodococcus sp. (in: high G+C Gram-positive bacteria)]